MKPDIRLYTFVDAPGPALYCFPHAGGTAPFFRPWAEHLPSGMALCAVQLPGRQDLMELPPFLDMPTLVDVVAHRVTEHANGRTMIFFGHSLGALTAFETARRLRRDALPGPAVLGISGCPAPHLDRPPRARHLLSDEDLLAEVAELGGLDERLLQSPELLRLTLPAVRADFALLSGYHFIPEPPLGCRLVAFGGLADHDVPVTSLHSWQEHSMQALEVHHYPGGHFFLERWSAAIIESLGPGAGGPWPAAAILPAPGAAPLSR